MEIERSAPHLKEEVNLPIRVKPLSSDLVRQATLKQDKLCSTLRGWDCNVNQTGMFRTAMLFFCETITQLS